MIVSLAVGGMISRDAWGRTMRRYVVTGLIPSASAASVCPLSTPPMPARTISAMYAASLRPRPRIAAMNGVITVFVSPLAKSGPNGMPRLISGRTRAEEEPEEQLHQDRRAAEEPDVACRGPAQHRVLREPHHREHSAQHDPDEHRDDRQLQRHQQTPHDRRLEEVAEHQVPVQRLVGGQELDEHGGVGRR